MISNFAFYFLVYHTQKIRTIELDGKTIKLQIVSIVVKKFTDFAVDFNFNEMQFKTIGKRHKSQPPSRR